MAYKVYITKSAEKDLEQIYDYISEDSPSNANRFISEIEEQILSLEDYPERNNRIPESNEVHYLDYRHLVYKDYRTIYRIVKQKVYIVRIIHGAKLLNL